MVKKSFIGVSLLLLLALPALAAAPKGFCGGRLQFKSATELEFVPATGNVIEVNGEDVDFGAGYNVTTSENLISNIGTDSGAAPSGSKVLYAYVSSSQSSYRPEDMGLSETAPAGVVAGLPYLDGSGNGLEWRYVGKAYHFAFGFSETATVLGVASFYNRVAKRVFLCPLYQNGNSVTTYTKGNTSWGSIGSISFMSHGDEAVTFEAFGRTWASNGWGNIGISVDNTNSPSRSGNNMLSSSDPNASVLNACRYDFKPLDGWHKVHLMAVTSGVTVIFYADLQRNGASDDQPATYLTGIVRM